VTQIQHQVLSRILGADQPISPPTALRDLPRLPFVRDLPAAWIAFGLWPAHVSPELRQPRTTLAKS
jgi:hypothetical protein